MNPAFCFFAEQKKDGYHGGCFLMQRYWRRDPSHRHQSKQWNTPRIRTGIGLQQWNNPFNMALDHTEYLLIFFV